MTKDLRAKRPKSGIVPYFKDPTFDGVSEGSGVYIFFSAGEMATEAMPQKIAGMDSSIPGYHGASIVNEVTATIIFRRNLRQTQAEPCFFGNFLRLCKYLPKLVHVPFIHGEEVFHVEEDIARARIFHHVADEVNDPLLLRCSDVLAEIEIKVVGDINPKRHGLFLPRLKQLYGLDGIGIVGSLGYMLGIIGEKVAYNRKTRAP